MTDRLRRLLGGKTTDLKCYYCGTKISAPKMFNDEDRSKLVPYCCATTVLWCQWLMYHGWHVEKVGNFCCPECFKPGTPEYNKLECCDDWVRQAKDWLNNRL